MSVSVIMPVRNEERHLEEAVSHVLRQDCPGDIEVVLAVGPSKDRTGEVAEKLAIADSRIRVVANPSGQRPNGLNAALRVARHDIVARVDGHALLPPGYLATAVSTLAQTGAVNVGGIMAAEGSTPFERAVAWAMTSPFGVGSARFHTGGEPGPADTVYLGVFRRDAVLRAGGYDEHQLRAEDWELNHRLRMAGGLIWFQPRMRVTYRPRSTVAALAEQYFGYGRWRRAVSRRHEGTINLRYLTPPVTVVAIAAGTLAGLAGLAGGPALLLAGFAVPVAYVAGVLGVTATATRTLPGRALAWLPVVLATMHVSWGSGFLTSPRSLTSGGGSR